MIIETCHDCIHPLRFLEGRQPLKLDYYQAECPKCHRLFTGHDLMKNDYLRAGD